MLFGLNIQRNESFDGYDDYEADLHLGDISLHICGADPERVAMMLTAIEEFVDSYPDVTNCYTH